MYLCGVPLVSMAMVENLITGHGPAAAPSAEAIVVVSRLLRHSAGGKNVTIAQRHYLGKSDALLRAAVDEAFEPYGGLLVPKGTADNAPLRAAGPVNATG